MLFQQSIFAIVAVLALVFVNLNFLLVGSWVLKETQNYSKRTRALIFTTLVFTLAVSCGGMLKILDAQSQHIMQAPADTMTQDR
jgi:hypothetical protein